MAAAEAKLSFDVAVDSVLDSLAQVYFKSIIVRRHLVNNVIFFLAEFLSLYIRHLV